MGMVANSGITDMLAVFVMVHPDAAGGPNQLNLFEIPSTSFCSLRCAPLRRAQIFTPQTANCGGVAQLWRGVA